jgi:hypothetical protein
LDKVSLPLVHVDVRAEVHQALGASWQPYGSRWR